MNLASSESAAPIPQPQSVEEAEALVKRLYQPGPARVIARLDECLKELQRSAQGFRIADAFLGNEDQNVRFFGALTFVIKINHDWDSLDEQTSREVLERLIFWFVRLVEAGESALVVRKLCSSLVAVFMQTRGGWQNCVCHLISCLSAKSVVQPPRGEILNEDIHSMLAALASPHFLAILWFATALIEEVGKMPTDSSNSQSCFESLLGDLPVILLAIQRGIDRSHPLTPKVTRDSLNLYQTLIFFTRKIADPERSTRKISRQLIPVVIAYLSDAEFYDEAVWLINDVMGNFEQYFTDEEYNSIGAMLLEPESKNRQQGLLSGDFEHSPKIYGEFLLDYGQARVEKLVKFPENPLNYAILQDCISLTCCEGMAIDEDEIVSPALDFWATFIETILDVYEASEEDPESEDESRRLCENIAKKVVENLLIKIQFPSPDDWADWDDDTKSLFHTFRQDFGHFLASAYACIGPYLLENFVSFTMNAWEQQDWAAVEAAIHSIGSVSVVAGGSSHTDASLATIFRSSLLTDLMNKEYHVPPKARQAGHYLISSYPEFFQRNPQYLESTIGYLFNCLQASVLVYPSAKTMAVLCNSCRDSLAPHALSFMAQSQQFIKAYEERDVKEKIFEAVTAAIQALSVSTVPIASGRSNAEEALKALGSLVESLKSDVLIEPSNQEDDEAKKSRIISVVKTLAAMGKAYRSAETVPIDLDAETNELSELAKVLRKEIQRQIVETYNLALSLYPADGELMEAVCNIFRAGFTESESPFLLPTQELENVFVNFGLHTTRIGFLLETVSRYLRREKGPTQSVESRQLAMRCLVRSWELVGSGRALYSSDPDIASSVIDFVEGYIPYHAALLFEQEISPQFEQFLRFCNLSLRQPDILPKRSAAAFWTHLLDEADKPPGVTEAVNGKLAIVGSELCRVLVFGVGGEAARSDLEGLIETLRKLVFKGGQVGNWIEGALFSADFPSTRVSDADKRIFKQTIVNLRGSRPKTSKVVKEFWIQCRGTFRA